MTGLNRIPAAVRSAMLILTLMGVVSASQASVGASVQIVDTAHQVTDLYNQIVSNVGAAVSDWGQHLFGGGQVDVEVQVTDSVARAAASSRASAYVGTQGGLMLYDAGAAYKINSGVDVNGAAPDIEILVNPSYLRNELWFDPDPASRQTAVPWDKTDAMSVFIHELGHALGFNGWGSSVDGSLPGNYASTWDVHTHLDGSALFFTGASSASVYGGAVPVTLGNNFHIGNATGAGSDLLGDVMNGVSFSQGRRYDISALDLAMAQDMGVQILAVPEPRTVWLMTLGLLLMGLHAGRRPRAAIIPA